MHASPTREGEPSRRALSVQRQLGLLLFVLAVPFLSLLAWSGVREYRLLKAEADGRSLALADATVASVRQLFAGAEGLITGLVEQHPEDLLDPGRCAGLLGPMNEIVPFVVNLLVARPDGSLVCTAHQGPEGPLQSVAQRRWFRSVLERPVYQVGDPQFGAITERWVVALAAPILGADGSVAGVLGGSVELRSFQDLLTGVEIGADDLVTIATDHDVVVARSRDPDGWIGTTLPGRRNPEVEVSPGRSLAMGTDLLGVARSWAQVRIPELGWWVYAGLPESAVWGPIRATAFRNILVSLSVILLALVLAATISRGLAGSLTQLLKGVREAGRPDELPVPTGAPREVVELALQFRESMEEQRRMEERLRQSQKMEALGRLAGGVAHDFNNILTVINGNAEILVRALPEDSPERVEAQEIANAASRAASVTRQLLTFSRRDRPRPRPLDLAGLARTMEVMLGRLIGEDIRWEARIAPDPLNVTADAGHLEQVILNLVLNARDAVDTGGRVALTVRPGTGPAPEDTPGARAGSWALIEVTDDGAGMDPGTRARIFEPFFTTKPRGRGTGLGLSTVFGIVDQMGAVVEVATAPGEGSTFRVWIPVAEGSPGAPEEAGDEEPHGAAGRTVLLVEDEPALRSMVARILGDAGYRVIQAMDGAHGLTQAMAHAGTIDLVFTDVVMPGMSGPELAEELARRLPRIPVLFATGYSEDPRIEKLLAMDPDRVLTKPFRSVELLRRVAQILNEERAAGR
ncbi:MAG TPA: ATP-binding protein [Longimicrobiales bacterium]|nr:ATP-binding protein [Longimicrobiales bacterium]